MKKIPLLFFLLGTVLMLNAQRSYLGLNFGMSLPGQEFAAKSLEENGGYALPGLLLDFSGAYIPDYSLGLAGTMTFGSNVPDAAQLEADIIKQLPGNIPDDAEIIFNYGSWIYTNVMAGPVVSLPSGKISLDIRFLAGPSFLVSPPLELTVHTADSTFFQSRNARTVNFGYMFGGGIRYQIRTDYSLRLYADYFSSNARLEQTDRNAPSGTIPDEESFYYTLKVRSLNIGIGLAYRF